MIDVGNAGDGPVEHLPDDFIVTSALLIAEAEAITQGGSNRRGPDPDGDPGAR